MLKATEKTHIKNIIIIIIFGLLSISILKSLTGTYAVTSMKHTIILPIVMYHQVKYTYLGKDVISPYEFENDLKYLSENNYHTITMADLINYVYYGEPLPDNSIILSFDDGYLSTYLNVFPLLKKYNMKIVLSVIGKSVDDYSKVKDENIEYSYVTWDEIKEMQLSGLVEIQNHSYNLHKICNKRYGCGQKYKEPLENYEKAITDDIITFQNKIKQISEITPNTFVYPYGKYNDNTEAILKKLGYKATLSCRYGVNLIRKDPDILMGLRRICRYHNYNISKLIKDGMETLKYR